jgi:hypothetical protein
VLSGLQVAGLIDFGERSVVDGMKELQVAVKRARGVFGKLGLIFEGNCFQLFV